MIERNRGRGAVRVPMMRVAMALGIATGAAGAQPPVRAPAGFVPRAAVSFGSVGAPAIAVDATHPLPVAGQGRGIVYTDRSGTIATGGTAQTVSAANAGRTGFMIQNLSAADLWLTSAGTATAGQPSFRIGAGQLFEFPASGVPTTALSLLGATTGQAFAAREW